MKLLVNDLELLKKKIIDHDLNNSNWNRQLNSCSWINDWHMIQYCIIVTLEHSYCLWWCEDTILKPFFLSITLSNIYGDHAWFWGKWSYKSLKRLLISFEIWLLHDHIKQIVINLKRTFSKSVKYFVRSGFPIMELHFIIWLPGELMFGKHENWPHHQFDHPAVYFSIKGF